MICLHSIQALTGGGVFPNDRKAFPKYLQAPSSDHVLAFLSFPPRFFPLTINLATVLAVVMTYSNKTQEAKGTAIFQWGGGADFLQPITHLTHENITRLDKDNVGKLTRDFKM